MNPTKEELEYLKELQKIHSDPEKRSRFYKRLSLILRMVGLVLFGVAYLLSRLNKLGDIEPLIIAMFGGMLIGLGVFSQIASRQVPWMSKFTNPDLNLIEERIIELENEKLCKASERTSFFENE